MPSILSRVEHTRGFLKLSSKPPVIPMSGPGGGGNVLDIDFKWWEGAEESEIPMRVNLMLVDSLMVRLVSECSPRERLKDAIGLSNAFDVER